MMLESFSNYSGVNSESAIMNKREGKNKLKTISQPSYEGYETGPYQHLEDVPIHIWGAENRLKKDYITYNNQEPSRIVELRGNCNSEIPRNVQSPNPIDSIFESSELQESKAKMLKKMSGNFRRAFRKNKENINIGNKEKKALNMSDISIIADKRYLDSIAQESNSSSKGLNSKHPNPYNHHREIKSDQFSPLWSYILSWVVYDQNESSDFPQQLSSDTLGSNEISKPRRKNIASRWSFIKDNWNRPLTGKIDQSRHLEASLTDSEHMAPTYVVEIDDKIGYPVNMIYDRHTSKLRPLDLMSGSSMYKQEPKEGHIYSLLHASIRSSGFLKLIFAPVDRLAEVWPSLQTLVILSELGIFIWLLYQLNQLIYALCMVIETICSPLLAIGKFIGRVI